MNLTDALNQYETELFDRYNGEVPGGHYWEPGEEDASRRSEEDAEAQEFISKYGIPFDPELPFS